VTGAVGRDMERLALQYAFDSNASDSSGLRRPSVESNGEDYFHTCNWHEGLVVPWVVTQFLQVAWVEVTTLGDLAAFVCSRQQTQA